MSSRLSILLVLAGLVLTPPGLAQNRPAPDDAVSEVFDLVPPDAAGVLLVENLKSRWAAIQGSPLARKLLELPAVREWRSGPDGERLEIATRTIEAALGASRATIRDELLGDAVALSLHPGPNGNLDQSHGLLLTRIRRPELVDRLVAASNDDEEKNGRLLRIEDKTAGGQTYHVRRFRDSSRGSDAYVTLDNRVFAWTNSESLLRELLERRARGEKGLSADPRLASFASSLGKSPLIRFFIDPAPIARAIAAEPSTPNDPFATLAGSWLDRMQFVGASFEWTETALALHVRELWKKAPSSPAAGPMPEVPTNALVSLAGRIPPSQVFQVWRGLLDAEDRERLDAAMEFLRTLMLDRDPTQEVLPALGPEWVASIDRPSDPRRLDSMPIVARVGVSDPGTRDAVMNGIRGLLQMARIDPANASQAFRVDSTRDTDTQFLALSVAAGTSRVDKVAAIWSAGWLALSNQREAARRSVSESDRSIPPPRTGTLLVGFINARAISEVALEAYDDLLARSLKDRPASEAGAARGDLDQLLALIGLFDHARLVHGAEPEGLAWFQTLELVPRKAP